MYRQSIILKVVSVVTAVAFIWTNTFLWAVELGNVPSRNYLAVDSGNTLVTAFRGAEILIPPLALQDRYIAKDVNTVPELKEWDRTVRSELVKEGVVRQSDLEKYISMISRDEQGNVVYYYINADGFILRITEKPDVRDYLYVALLSKKEQSKPSVQMPSGKTIQIYKISEFNEDSIRFVLRKVWGDDADAIFDGIKSHLFPKYIHDAIASRLSGLVGWDSKKVEDILTKGAAYYDVKTGNIVVDSEALKVIAEVLSEVLSAKQVKQITITSEDVKRVLLFHEMIEQKIAENSGWFKGQLEVILDRIKEYYKGDKNKIKELFDGFCRNYAYSRRLSDIELLREMLVHDFIERYFFNQPIRIIDTQGKRQDIPIELEAILLGPVAGLFGKWLNLTDQEKIEKITEIYSIVLGLPEHGERFFRILYGKYLGADELLIIGENFFPSCFLDKEVEDRWLGSVELSELIGYKDKAKDAVYWAMPMFGGTGSSVKRTKYLSRIKGRPITEKDLQDKSSDLYFEMEIKKPNGATVVRQISIMEAKLIKLILEVEAGEYGEIIFERRSDIWKLVKDIPYVFDQKGRSYDEYINEELVKKGKFRMTSGMRRMGQFPTVFVPWKAKKDKGEHYLTADNRAPVGHAAFGIGVLLLAYDGEVPDTKGAPIVLGLYNGDGVNNRVDSSMVGWMVGERVAITIVSTDKTGIDKKGGQIGIRCINPGAPDNERVYVPQIMELAQAKKVLPSTGQTQERRFQKVGLPGGEGKQIGKQKFNTNTVLFNMGLLMPFLQELGIAVGRKLFKVKYNRDADMDDAKDKEEVIVLGRGYVIDIATPDLIANAEEKYGRKFIKLEGALASTVMNFAAFIDTNPDKDIQDLKEKYFGKGPFLRFINVSTDDRTGYFTPEKVAFDHWIQSESDRFKFNPDSAVWALEDNYKGKPLPIIDITDTYYTDVENCIESFVNLNIGELEKWGIRGKVKLSDCILSGRVEILSVSDNVVDIMRYRDRLIRDYGCGEENGKLVLEDICIVVDDNDVYVFRVNMDEEKDLWSGLVQKHITEIKEHSPILIKALVFFKLEELKKFKDGDPKDKAFLMVLEVSKEGLYKLGVMVGYERLSNLFRLIEFVHEYDYSQNKGFTETIVDLFNLVSSVAPETAKSLMDKFVDHIPNLISELKTPEDVLTVFNLVHSLAYMEQKPNELPPVLYALDFLYKAPQIVSKVGIEGLTRIVRIIRFSDYVTDIRCYDRLKELLNQIDANQGIEDVKRALANLENEVIYKIKQYPIKIAEVSVLGYEDSDNNSVVKQMLVINKLIKGTMWSGNVVTDRLRKKKREGKKVFVAYIEVNGQKRIIGQILSAGNQPGALAVMDVFQTGFGVGKILSRHVIEEVQRDGYAHVFLQVRETNTSGLSFWRNLPSQYPDIIERVEEVVVDDPWGDTYDRVVNIKYWLTKSANGVRGSPAEGIVAVDEFLGLLTLELVNIMNLDLNRKEDRDLLRNTIRLLYLRGYLTGVFISGDGIVINNKRYNLGDAVVIPYILSGQGGLKEIYQEVKERSNEISSIIENVEKALIIEDPSEPTERVYDLLGQSYVDLVKARVKQGVEVEPATVQEKTGDVSIERILYGKNKVYTRLALKGYTVTKNIIAAVDDLLPDMLREVSTGLPGPKHNGIINGLRGLISTMPYVAIELLIEYFHLRVQEGYNVAEREDIFKDSNGRSIFSDPLLMGLMEQFSQKGDSSHIKLAEKIRKYIDRDKTRKYRVLLIATGSGRLARELYNEFKDNIEIVETDLEMGTVIRNYEVNVKKGLSRGIKQVPADVGNLGTWDNESFDMVVCFGGVRYFADIRGKQSSREIARVLKPDGLAILSDVVPSHIDTGLMLRYREKLDDYMSVYFEEYKDWVTKNTTLYNLRHQYLYHRERDYNRLFKEVIDGVKGDRNYLYAIFDSIDLKRGSIQMITASKDDGIARDIGGIKSHLFPRYIHDAIVVKLSQLGWDNKRIETILTKGAAYYDVKTGNIVVDEEAIRVIADVLSGVLSKKISAKDMKRVLLFHETIEQKIGENSEWFKGQLEVILDRIKEYYKGDKNKIKELFDGFCRNYAYSRKLSDIELLREMLVHDFVERYFFGQPIRIIDGQGQRQDIPIELEAVILGPVAGLFGKWLNLTNKQKVEKITEIYSAVLGLPEHGKRFFRILYKKYLSKDNVLIIGRNFFPSCFLDKGVEDRWLGSVELSKLGRYRGKAKGAVYWAIPMLGGIGAGVKRTRYLSRIKGRAITEKDLQDKSSDLYFEMVIRKPNGTTEVKQISIMEAKLIKLILEVEAGEYGEIIFEMRPDIWALVKDIPYIFDPQSRSYEEYIQDELINKGKFRMTSGLKRMGQFPTVFIPPWAEDGKRLHYLTADYRVPVGHAAFGIGVLLLAYDGEVPDTKGSPIVLGLYNGDGVNNRADSSMVGWMADKKVAIAIVSTDKTGIDKKGGQIGIRCINPKAPKNQRVYVPQIMELAQAKRVGKAHEKRFYKVGLPGGEGKRIGKQKFNTNTVLFNMGLLMPFLQELGIIAGKKLFKIKHNRDADMNNTKDGEEVIALGRGYVIDIATPDLIANAEEKGGRKFIKLEGALASTVMNFAAFIDTNPDRDIRRLKRKHFGKGPFLRFINVSADDRTGYFTPEKVAFDHWIQSESDRFRFNPDPKVWALEDNYKGKPLPIIDITDSYYTDVENCRESFVNLDIGELEKWGIRGKVKIENCILKGRVEILSISDNVMDLMKYRSELITKFGCREENGKLVLEDICIVVDDNDVYAFSVNMDEELDLDTGLVQEHRAALQGTVPGILAKIKAGPLGKVVSKEKVKDATYAEIYQLELKDGKIVGEGAYGEGISHVKYSNVNSNLLKQALAELVSRFGEGILAVADIIRIVDNIGVDTLKKGKDGILSYAMMKKERDIDGKEINVLLLDVDVFSNPNLLRVILRHELRESIMAIVPYENEAIRELTTNYMSIVECLEERIEIGYEDLKALGADTDFLNVLEVLRAELRGKIEPGMRIEEIQDETLKREIERKILSAVMVYMMQMPYYRDLFADFPAEVRTYIEQILKDVDDAKARYRAALNMFNDILGPETEGAESIQRKLEEIAKTVDVNIKVVKTFAGEKRLVGLQGLPRLLQTSIGAAAKAIWGRDLLVGTLEKVVRESAYEDQTYWIVVDKGMRDRVGEEAISQQIAVIDGINKRCGRDLLRVVNDIGEVKDTNAFSKTNPRVIYLCDIEDWNYVEKAVGRKTDMFYMPTLYTSSSLLIATHLILAGGDVSAMEDKMVADIIRSFYGGIVGREIGVDELNKLFRKPWLILPEITKVSANINALRMAILQIESAA